jgi:hypothetical protein
MKEIFKNKTYSKTEQFISFFVLFFFLFNLVFRVPFSSNTVYADESVFHNLVSIIVDEETYDEIDDELERYAKDIQ